MNKSNTQHIIQLGSQLAGLGIINDTQQIDRLDKLPAPGYRLSSQSIALAEKILHDQTNESSVLSFFALCDQEKAGIAGTQLGLALCILSKQATLIINTISHTENLDGVFGEEENSGLVGLLRNETKLEECIQTTEVPQLSYLSFGDCSRYAPALLSAQRFQDILEKITLNYPRIILLCPTPSHDETTSLIMCSHQIIGLAMRGETSTSQVNELSTDCQDLNKTYMGTILTES
jgi:hypothetical protein